MARRPLLAGALAAAVLTWAPPAPAASCAPPEGARVVTETDDAVVTLVTRGEDGDPFEGTTTYAWRGCAAGTGTQVVLQDGFSALFSRRDAEGFELAGPWVAFLAGRADDKYESFSRLVTVDLRTGARWESSEVSSFGGLGFTEHAVNRRGNAAWVRRTYGARSRPQWRLYVQRGGRVVRRDTASRPLVSLRLSSTRVLWREGGRRRSLPIAT